MDSLVYALESNPWLGWSIAFVLGSIVGSFLNVCIYRIPAEKSVIWPGSKCACGKSIAWYDNFPILSWFLLRGNARCCDLKFSIRYPLVECLTGILFLLAWATQSPAVAVCYWVFFALLVPAVFIDLDHFIIPDRFSVGGMFVGIVLSALVPELHGFANPGGIAVFDGLASAIVGALIGSAVLYWFGAIAEIVFRKEALGQGDVKLAGCFGAFCGWEGAVFALFGGAVIGTVFLVPVLIWQRLNSGESAVSEDREDESETLGFGSAVPFGPMLCAAVVLYVLFFEELVRDWFDEVGLMLQAIL